MLEIRKQRLGSQRSIHERERRKRMIRRVVVSIVVLLFLLISAAIVYVWYMGRHPAQQAVETVDTRSAAPVVKTYAPDPDAPVGISEQSFTRQTAPGANATISVKTTPGAACQISVKMSNDSAITDSGLVPKIADDFGIVSWSWTVPQNGLIGKWPVEITCANEAKKSAYFRDDLEVNR